MVVVVALCDRRHLCRPAVSIGAKWLDKLSMSPQSVNQTSRDGERPTRREVLWAAVAAGVSALVASGGSAKEKATSKPVPDATAHQPWWLREPYTRSRVVDIRSGRLLHGSIVDRAALGEVVDRGVRALTGAPSSAEAWRAILGGARRIVLKFNSVGARVIGTNRATAQVLVEALSEAGYDPAGITLVEVPRNVPESLGTRKPETGWGSPIAVGGHMEPMAEYLYAADALVNVALLKSHQIAGMSGCMKNLSHALIQHPARFHDNGCAPYVGQVIGNKEVSSRLKLNLVDAIRMVVRNGPDAAEEDLFPHRGLLLGFDPVAVDTVGLALLGLRRRQAGLKSVPAVRYIESAAERGVGRRQRHELEQLVIEERG